MHVAFNCWLYLAGIGEEILVVCLSEYFGSVYWLLRLVAPLPYNKHNNIRRQLGKMLAVIISIQCDFPREYLFVYFVSLWNTTSVIERRNWFRNIVNSLLLTKVSVPTLSEGWKKNLHFLLHRQIFLGKCKCWRLVCLSFYEIPISVVMLGRMTTVRKTNISFNNFLKLLLSSIYLTPWRKSFERIFSYLSFICGTQCFIFIFSELCSKKEVNTVKNN